MRRLRFRQPRQQITPIDVYGLNVYNWCSETEVYQNSGYKGIMDDYQNYGIPMILSEFGCNGGDFVTSPQNPSVSMWGS